MPVSVSHVKSPVIFKLLDLFVRVSTEVSVSAVVKMNYFFMVTVKPLTSACASVMTQGLPPSWACVWSEWVLRGNSLETHCHPASNPCNDACTKNHYSFNYFPSSYRSYGAWLQIGCIEQICTRKVEDFLPNIGQPNRRMLICWHLMDWLSDGTSRGLSAPNED
jgi:hypothetical protein